ncbi:hypothetical protein FN976_24220 [Caenimonas sedimenti]|uniref:Uncharacterized protein n=1 Tax=Caenimonas sedimenti TaxID=2596921 RepID=A0A562ZHH9_9BURK|nr:hypothetical protein [Caenimonas sedimenti]TWO68050.1 hypothetical protein FN976_24220 [Caenimonas sedimenti]
MAEHAALCSHHAAGNPVAAWVREPASASVMRLLAVFAVVNSALFILKGCQSEWVGRFEISCWVPAAGTLICLVLIGVRVYSSDLQAPVLAGSLLLGILALYALLRPSGELAPIAEAT